MTPIIAPLLSEAPSRGSEQWTRGRQAVGPASPRTSGPGEAAWRLQCPNARFVGIPIGIHASVEEREDPPNLPNKGGDAQWHHR